MRVAVVQAELPIQSYTRDLINGLCAQGFELELVTRSEDWQGYVAPESVRAPVHKIKAARIPRAIHTLHSSIARLLGTQVGISPAHSHGQVQRFLTRSAPFHLIIGIEKAGLELAAHFAVRAKIPLVYYSLELYLDDHPEYPNFSWKRGSEIESHRRASATIIQDRSRWEVLKTANRPVSDEVFFLPVGVPALEKRTKPRAASEEAPLKVLYMGLIAERRFADELLQAAATLPEGTRLHLHGPITATFEKTLAQRVLPHNVIVTSTMLDEPALGELVEDAAIGLALYRRDYANDRLTAFSSQKIAMYLRAGVPVVTFKSESYAELFSRFPCGEMIDDLSDLSNALRKILARRSDYSNAALDAFAAIYDIELYWAPLGTFLARLPHQHESVAQTRRKS